MNDFMQENSAVEDSVTPIVKEDILISLGVELGPLGSKPHTEPESVAYDSEWLSRHLQPALQGARNEGEQLLGTVDMLVARLFPTANDDSLVTVWTRSVEEQKAWESLQSARECVQNAWTNLVNSVKSGLEAGTLAVSIDKLLEIYRQEAVAGIELLRNEPSWRAVWPLGGTEATTEANTAKTSTFTIGTSQEMDILLRSICDGYRGTNWTTNVQAGMRIYERAGLSHSVRLSLQEEEVRAGLDVNVLERLTHAQDADAAFAILYVSRVLAPSTPLPPNARAGAWVSADDIMEKIGWDPRSSEERRLMRRKIWDYLRFGARANVIGRRTSKYRDPKTGEEIDTFIDGPAWAFMKEEKPTQPSLFADEDVPVRVELVMSTEWTQFTVSPLFAQYLPLGEVLGSIRPDKPSGAWARVLGLALASFWRRNPRAALDGTLKPTRRELLDHYPPKVAPPQEVLESRNPKRAIDYWCSGLAILAESGFVENTGEVARHPRDIAASLPRYNWRDNWLDEPVDLRPGPAMVAAVQATADSLPLPKPINYRLLGAKKGKRPPKTKSSAG